MIARRVDPRREFQTGTSQNPGIHSAKQPGRQPIRASEAHRSNPELGKHCLKVRKQALSESHEIDHWLLDLRVQTGIRWDKAEVIRELLRMARASDGILRDALTARAKRGRT
ncbi:hypothetical protein [Streptomyces cyaneofuscatus]|uniref:hypothetical protein n=1 Tax=Streptomyces cyaneofuscatus TaxID=66883 RepID=UPI003790DAB6